MPKLVAMWQSVKIEYIRVAQIEDGILKIGGEILDSNFVEAGKKTLMPIHAENVSNRLCVGDIIKISFYTPKGETEEIDDEHQKIVTFKDCGTKYELWNHKAQGWDKIFEIFKPSSD